MSQTKYYIPSINVEISPRLVQIISHVLIFIIWALLKKGSLTAIFASAAIHLVNPLSLRRSSARLRYWTAPGMLQHPVCTSTVRRRGARMRLRMLHPFHLAGYIFSS